jgi:hypothetical protein
VGRKKVSRKKVRGSEVPDVNSAAHKVNSSQAARACEKKKTSSFFGKGNPVRRTFSPKAAKPQQVEGLP